MIGALLLATALTYKIPEGWVDLADPSVEARRYPANTVREARSGKYKIYAVSDEKVTALLNVIESPEGVGITKPMLDRSVKEASALARARGFTWTTIGTEIAQLQGVDIGVAHSTITSASGTLRLEQYFIPGEKNSATLTYACKPEQFATYQSTFAASAMATTGAYTYRINWNLILKIAVDGAIVSLLLAFLGVKLLAPRRSPS